MLGPAVDGVRTRKLHQMDLVDATSYESSWIVSKVRMGAFVHACASPSPCFCTRACLRGALHARLRARPVQAASGVGENAVRQRNTVVREIRPQVRLVPHAQHLSVEFHGSLHVLHKDACMLQFAVSDRRGPGNLCGASAHGVCAG